MPGLLIIGIFLLPVLSAAVFWQLQRDVVVFWDYENCHIPKREKPLDVVGRVHKIAKSFGTVKAFKVYVGPEPGIAPATLEDALREYQGQLIIGPHRSKKGDVGNMICRFTDMLMDALLTHDQGFCDKDKTTFIFISGDGDFIKAVERLQESHYKVVIISPSQHGNPELRRLACDHLDWETVSGVKT